MVAADFCKYYPLEKREKKQKGENQEVINLERGSRYEIIKKGQYGKS